MWTTQTIVYLDKANGAIWKKGANRSERVETLAQPLPP